MRPGLRAEYGAPDEDQCGVVEFLWLRWHQRHPGIRPDLSQTVTVALKPSRVLALALTLMAGAALACVWISLPRVALLPAATGIALAWIWHLAPVLQRGRRAVRVLEVTENGDARWQDGLGQWNEAEIQSGSYVSNWLIVVNLGTPGRRGRALVLLPDCAAAEELRRLRVWLRWRLARQ